MHGKKHSVCGGAEAAFLQFLPQTVLGVKLHGFELYIRNGQHLFYAIFYKAFAMEFDLQYIEFLCKNGV